MRRQQNRLKFLDLFSSRWRLEEPDAALAELLNTISVAYLVYLDRQKESTAQLMSYIREGRETEDAQFAAGNGYRYNEASSRRLDGCEGCEEANEGMNPINHRQMSDQSAWLNHGGRDVLFMYVKIEVTLKVASWLIREYGAVFPPTHESRSRKEPIPAPLQGMYDRRQNEMRLMAAICASDDGEAVHILQCTVSECGIAPSILVCPGPLNLLQYAATFDAHPNYITWLISSCGLDPLAVDREGHDARWHAVQAGATSVVHVIDSFLISLQ
jgi:hypothetical protein